MNQYIKDIEFALQALALRSTDMVDRLPILKVVDEMNLSIKDLPAGQERLMLKVFVDKIEGTVK